MIIKNYKKLASSKKRTDALKIVEAGLKAINPEKVIKEKVKLRNNILSINNKKFNLNKFKRTFVIGFGKASHLMARAVESILKNKIEDGIVISVENLKLKKIKIIKGTHPLPSKINVNATKKIVKLVSNLDKDDLVICLISGGGSTLFTDPIIGINREIEIGKRMLDCGVDIEDVNLVRKHIDKVKGGDLTKYVYPATLISLIISDVAGNKLNSIASGPTVYEKSKIEDAKRIIKKCDISNYKLVGVVKDKKYFKNVHNILILTNKDAIKVMEKEAKKLKYKVKIYSTKVEGEARVVGKRLTRLSKKGYCILAAGETTVTVKGNGKGGRNQELCLAAIKDIEGTLISIGSDGMDNSDVAGAIIDEKSFEKSKKIKLNYKKYLDNNDSYNFFKKMKDQIITGKTGTNVADLIVILS